MADLKQIQFKRSKTAGARPTTAQIAEGELAINLKDRTFFTSDGTQIIDLGLAKGGQIDGNITQSGSTTISNELTVGMDITAKRNVIVSGQVVSGSDLRSDSGVIRTRAAANSNSHVWFEGEEMTRSNYERAVMYASPQTAAADGGGIRLRVQNGTQAGAGQALFLWTGSGDFTAPRDLYAQRSRLSIESIAPTMNTNRLFTAYKPFGAQQYSWEDTVTYTKATGALNYVYKGRANIEGTIWHNIIDERTGAENVWYTGSGPENKMYSLASRGAKGHGFYTGSLMIGANNLGEYSGMGDSSIALGDNDTGFKWTGDGAFSIMSNNQKIVDIYNSATKPFYIKKCTKIVHSDNNSDNLFPSNNNALLEIDTSLDGNNAGGNGVTLIGYNSGSRYYHYFRGRGSANFDMDNGVYISKGGLSVTGNISSTGQVQPSNYSNFDSRYQNLLQLGANVNLDTLAGDNHAGEYAQNMNVNTSLALNYPEAQAGHLTITSGAGVQQRYHVYNSTRVYLRAKYSSDSWRPWDRVVTEDYLKTGIPYQFVSKNSDGFRIAYGSYGFFIRNDGGSTYFMLTNSGDQMGTWNGLRPMSINNSTGNVSMGHELRVNGELALSGRTINFLKSGAVPRNMKAFLAGDSDRGNRIEITDDTAYLMYIERNPSSGVQLVLNGGHLKTNSGNVYTNSIQLNSGAQLVADGNIYLPNATNGFSSGWLLGQINSRLNTAQSTANGKWTYNQGTIDGRVTAVGDGRYAPLGTFNSTAIQAVRYGSVVNFGSLNQTSNQRICDQGYFMVGMNGTGGQQNNSMNVIAARIQVKRLNGTWVDSPVT